MAVVWRILLVGTDGSLYLIVGCLFQFRCLNSALWTWYCNNVFPRTLVIWNGLSIVSSSSLLDTGWKTWIFRVLSLGVLDGTVRCSQLSGCLVSSGGRAPPKVCYFGRFYHMLVVVVICSIIFVSCWFVFLSNSPLRVWTWSMKWWPFGVKVATPTLHLTTREWGCKISFTQSLFEHL